MEITYEPDHLATGLIKEAIDKYNAHPSTQHMSASERRGIVLGALADMLGSGTVVTALNTDGPPMTVIEAVLRRLEKAMKISHHCVRDGKANS